RWAHIRLGSRRGLTGRCGAIMTDASVSLVRGGINGAVEHAAVDVESAAGRAAALITAEVRSVLEVTVAQGELIRSGANQDAAATTRDAHDAAHRVRDEIDTSVAALARLLTTVRTERDQLAAELNAVSSNGAVITL